MSKPTSVDNDYEPFYVDDIYCRNAYEARLEVFGDLKWKEISKIVRYEFESCLDFARMWPDRGIMFRASQKKPVRRIGKHRPRVASRLKFAREPGEALIRKPCVHRLGVYPGR